MCRFLACFAFKGEDARIDTELMLISTHDEYNVRFLWSARLKWYKNEWTRTLHILAMIPTILQNQ